MGFHSSISAIPMECRRQMATHSLDHSLNGISNRVKKTYSNSQPGRDLWKHISKSNEAQEAYSNSLPGRDLITRGQ